MDIIIDIDKLRKDLIDYFGTAMYTISPLAMINLSKIENANKTDLIKIALANNIDLNKYKYNKNRR